MEGSDSWPVPPPFRRTSSHVVERRGGGGCISLVGLPFFLVGVFMALAELGMVHIGGAPPKGWARLVFALMSVALLGLGAGLVFGRRWLRLDIGSGSLSRSWGLLIPMRTQYWRLSEFNAIVIAFIQGDSESPDQFPVRLRAIGGKDFTVHSPTQFGAARAEGGFLARFLGLPLVDMTTDHEVVVSAELASATLQERLLAGAAQTDRPDRPPAMHAEVSESASGEITIVIPGRRSQVNGWVGALVCVFIVLLVVPAAWRFSQTHAPVGAKLFFVGFLVLFFGILPLGATSFAFGAVRTRVVVTASRAGLVIERRIPWRVKSTIVSASDILDVDYSTFDGILESTRRSAQFSTPALTGGGGQRIFSVLKKLVPSKGIIVKSRQGLVTFGEGLGAEELRFLKWMLIKALAGDHSRF